MFLIFAKMLREERVYASDFNASAGAGTGMLAGTGVAALGPSAAMAIATTLELLQQEQPFQHYLVL